jgi:hypothetical protein
MRKLVCLSVILMMGTLSNAALLSGNTVSEDTPLFPVGTAKINTGATYQWLAGSASQIVNNDLSSSKMIDGVGAAGGGNHAVWSDWDGADATLVFDLKAQYEITGAGVYTNLDWPNVGLPYLDVYTSVDGSNYTLFGGWQENPANGTDVFASVSGQTVHAQFVKFDFKRNVWPPQGDRQNWSHQYIIGEAMVYGNVPEPATMAMLSLGGLFMALRNKRK